MGVLFSQNLYYRSLHFGVDFKKKVEPKTDLKKLTDFDLAKACWDLFTYCTFDMFYTFGALLCVSKYFDILFMQSVFSKLVGYFLRRE